MAFSVDVVTATSFATGVSGRPLWPSDISGLILWLPADQIQGIASGASLSNWTDSSASAKHGVQASAASQPIFVVNVQNGLSAVSFGKAVSQLMISQTSLADTATVALAFQQSAATTATQMLIGSSTTVLRLQSSASITYASGSTLSVAGTVPTTWQSLIAFGSGSTTTVSLSGSITTGAGPGVAGTSSNSAAIGAATASSKTWSGYIGEICVWNRNLFEIERSSLESYLRTKWAI